MFGFYLSFFLKNIKTKKKNTKFEKQKIVLFGKHFLVFTMFPKNVLKNSLIKQELVPPPTIGASNQDQENKTKKTERFEYGQNICKQNNRV